jgi:antirestriction protein ArdC
MSKHTARARSGSDRTSFYDEITTKIIDELEAGRVPWVQPWGTAAAKAPLTMPKNAATSRNYSGINVLILWGSVIEHGFPVQGWVTFRQALSLGGNVRKGEHGTTVVYADRFIPDDEKKRARETGEEAQAIPFLKRFTVFNLAQCEGLTAPSSAQPRKRARPQSSSSAFFPATTNALSPQRIATRKRRDTSTAGLAPRLWRSRPSRKAGFVRMRIAGSADLRRPRGKGLRRSS